MFPNDLFSEIVAFTHKNGIVKTMQLFSLCVSGYDNELSVSGDIDTMSLTQTHVLDDAMKTLNQWVRDHES